jgi:protein tyrosine phosphatase (PTP) superfamily phosphohydrolase (DUF442 family)
MRWGRVRRRVVRPGLVVLLAGLGFVLVRWGSGNFGVVAPGRIYRSAQLSPEKLEEQIRRHGIKTVLNLRGSNVQESWYAGERAATLRAGATQVDVTMASDQWLARDQAATLIDVLTTSEPPILVHCEWGAERTGLVAAMAELLRPGSTTAEARRQFSAWYLFLPIRDGKRMLQHLEQYESWLRARGDSHTPARFRRWLAHDYRPGPLSRESWPCEPYPLKLVSDPDGVEVATWSFDRPRCPKVHR